MEYAVAFLKRQLWCQSNFQYQGGSTTHWTFFPLTYKSRKREEFRFFVNGIDEESYGIRLFSNRRERVTSPKPKPKHCLRGMSIWEKMLWHVVPREHVLCSDKEGTEILVDDATYIATRVCYTAVSEDYITLSYSMNADDRIIFNDFFASQLLKVQESHEKELTPEQRQEHERLLRWRDGSISTTNSSCSHQTKLRYLFILPICIA